MNPALINPQHTEFCTWHDHVKVIYNATVYDFDHAPLTAIDLLAEALENDRSAQDGLTLMGIHNPVERMKQYAKCRYGNLNDSSDFGSKNTDDEMINCQHQHTCKGSGLVCHKKFKVHGEKLSAREVEVGFEIARGLTAKDVADAKCVSEITIQTTLLHIKQKLNLTSRHAIAAFFTSQNFAI